MKQAIQKRIELLEATTGQDESTTHLVIYDPTDGTEIKRIPIQVKSPSTVQISLPDNGREDLEA
jgi:S-adenosylmethionine hydrolase